MHTKQECPHKSYTKSRIVSNHSTMEFADLNDEIIADDWLIPNEEISKRRLIKQTLRYNIYKADWFGDVLVYEPASGHRKQQLASRRQQKINQDELSCRLSRLSLSSGLESPSAASVFSSSLCSPTDSEQTDSAYSSISSTPQCNAKKFEFPTSKLCSPSLSSSSLASSMMDDYNNNHCIQLEEHSTCSELLDKSEYHSTKRHAISNNSGTPVILNKESFKFCSHDKSPCSANIIKEIGDIESSWFELNELRLVAHENFMLFMGASENNQLDGSSQETSLVMQMNHPKAVSLYNLLHGSNLQSSPIDRFYSYKHQRQQFSDGAKLNICQQVMNAMTYLHDKNIVHGKLTSVNIYIEPNRRVKISLIDNDDRAIASLSGRQNCVEFNLPSLTYLSPELIKTISVVNGSTSRRDNKFPAHVQFDTNQLTKASDIFSFGTLLFELFEERFPFAQAQDITTMLNSLKLSILDSPTLLIPDSTQTKWHGNIKVSANELIYQIGSGHIESKNLKDLDKMKRRPALVEHIIERCWSRDPLMRPQFKQLASML